LRRVLLATWGIGPETADCVVVYAARKPAFVVDAYTARVFSRLGIGPGETAGYHAWQALFTSQLEPDRDFWARYHALVVMHAKHLCRKSRPLCGECSLRGACGWPAGTGR
jgi:endonuclease-3 related protein